ncbi:MAG: amidohydrolase [Clostridia bacterium]|nr:amidohydrolase [Clostridia bacterium]
MRKIFDIHTHIYPERIAAKASVNLGHFYNFVVEGEGTYAALERTGAESGVFGFLLLGVATNPTQVESVNDFIAETVKLSRERGFSTYGFLGMHQDHPDFSTELDRAVAKGLSGVKIHPDIQGVDIDDKRLYELYSLIEGKLPLYLHMGDDRPEYRFSSPSKLAKVLAEFPRLTVVAAHLGGYRAWDEAVECLAGRENVWYDTSSALWAMTPEYADSIISKLGTERLMFGTDYPVKNTDEEVRRVLALRLTEEEREAVFYKNALRFFGAKE